MSAKQFQVLVRILLVLILLAGLWALYLGFQVWQRTVHEARTPIPTSTRQPVPTRLSPTPPAPEVTANLPTAIATPPPPFNADSNTTPQALPAAHPTFPAGQACSTCHQTIHRPGP